jgi:hypothetical protein
MGMAKMRSGEWIGLIIAIWFILLMVGCGRGLPDSPAEKSSTIASKVDDPDAYKPLKPRSTPPPPPSPLSKKDEQGRHQPAQIDPDVYVPEKPPTRPATQPKKEHAGQNDSDAHTSPKPSSPPPSPPTPPKNDESDRVDPDVYVPEKPRSPAKTVPQVLAEKKSANAANNKGETKLLNLEAQLSLYQSDKADAATRLALEKQFIASSREALRISLGFGTPQSAPSPPTPDWLSCVGRQLWDSPFVDFLDLQHRALTTLAQRPTVVALAMLIPNKIMRADLQRTLSRHWPEGPKAIRTLAAANYPLAEPGFITVLKTLTRENQVKSWPQWRLPKSVRSSYNPEGKPAAQRKTSSDEDWNKLLGELVQDYCRRSHMASLARLAAAYRDGAATLPENRVTDSPIPLLPGCEISAAYSIDWPGEHVSRLPNMAGNDLSLNYQRIEKRMKPSKPLTYYRLHVKSSIERPIPNGLWLDGFVDLKGEERLRSVDVLITCPANSTYQSASEEQELTVEILCIEVRKSLD